MGYGAGNLQTLSRNDPTVIPPPGPPFLLTSADNGLSVDPVTKKIVLGQSIGAIGNPAQLLDNREIPFNGFDFIFGNATDNIQFFLLNSSNFLVYNIAGLTYFDLDPMGVNLLTGAMAEHGLSVDATFPLIQLTLNSNQYLLFDLSSNLYQLGDINGNLNGTELSIDDTNQQIIAKTTTGDMLFLDNGIGSYFIGDISGIFGNFALGINGANGNMTYNSLFNSYLDISPSLNEYRIGDISATGNGNFFFVEDATSKFKITNTGLNSIMNINGVDGFTGTVTPVTTITVNGGIVTNVA